MKLTRKIRYYFSQPPGVLPWALSRNHNSLELRHHRKTTWAVPRKSITFLFWTFYIFQLFFWYLFFAWKNLYKGGKYIKQHAQKTGITIDKKHYRKLAELLFVYTIPFNSIKRYQLLEQPQSSWLSHIYPHELPKWQYALSKDISQDAHMILNNKHYFAEVGIEHNLPCIETLIKIGQDSTTKDIEMILAIKQSCFIKPLSANRSQGCYTLSYAGGYYMLHGIGSKDKFSTSSKIINEIEKINKKYSLIVQPVLKNTPLWKNLSTSSELITLRIISEIWNKNCQLLSAVLEIPIEDGGKFYDLIPVDPESGSIHNQKFGSRITTNNERQEQLLASVASTKIPHWNQIIKILTKAHNMVPSVRIVGWDVALIEEGPVVIEGNFGGDMKMLTKNDLATKRLQDIKI